MAAEWDETCLDLSVSDYDPNSILRLQALCRGWLVRKKLKDIQTEFQQIVLELDGPATEVEWTESTPPHPIVCKRSKKTRKNQNRASTRKHSCDSISWKKSDRATESKCPKCAEKTKDSATEKDNSVDGRTKQPEKSQSDRQVQTEFSQTSQPSLASEKTQREDDKKCQPTTTDSIPPHRDFVCEKENQTQNSAEIDSRKIVKDTEASEDERHRKVDDNGAVRETMHPPFQASSDVAASSSSLRSSPQIVPPLSDSLAGVTGHASESCGMRRVDSFHGDQTSVWDSGSSIVHDQEAGTKLSSQGHRVSSAVRSGGEGPLEMEAEVSEVKLRDLNTDELLKQRQNVAMELLWVQQAIISRKKYMKLKMQMDGAA